MALIDYLSSTARSVIYTMTCAGKKSPMQRLPSELYVMPSADQRILAARLILEEALETVRDLGVLVRFGDSSTADVKDVVVSAGFADVPEQFDMLGAIDGCIDLRYVATWALCVMGVPDLLHEREVNRANNAKFPDGVAIVDEHGKYRKPEGWIGPDHKLASDVLLARLKRVASKESDLRSVGDRIVSLGGRQERGEE